MLELSLIALLIMGAAMGWVVRDLQYLTKDINEVMSFIKNNH